MICFGVLREFSDNFSNVSVCKVKCLFTHHDCLNRIFSKLYFESLNLNLIICRDKILTELGGFLGGGASGLHQLFFMEKHNQKHENLSLKLILSLSAMKYCIKNVAIYKTRRESSPATPQEYDCQVSGFQIAEKIQFLLSHTGDDNLV